MAMIGGQGLKVGFKVLDVYIGLTFLAGILGAAGVGLYGVLGTITQQMSVFGTIGVWVVGGILYLLVSVWILYEVLGMLKIKGGGF